MFNPWRPPAGRWIAAGAVCTAIAVGFLASKLPWRDGVRPNSPPEPRLSLPDTDGTNMGSLAANEVRISPETLLVFERRWEECETVQTRSVPAGEKLAGADRDTLAREFSDWQLHAFATDRVVLVQTLPGDCPEPDAAFTITIRQGRVIVLRGASTDGPLYLDTGIAADSLLPGDRMMLERGVTVTGEERVWAYLEGMGEDLEH